jgi:hypothetical protein
VWWWIGGALVAIILIAALAFGLKYGDWHENK